MLGRRTSILIAFAALFGSALVVAGCAKPATDGGSGSGGTSGQGCGVGQTSCSSGCKNTQVDAQNCGGCGIACQSGQICSSGTCTCGSGLTLCNENGSTRCVDLTSTNTDCGMCGKSCNGLFCSNSSCASTCASGTTQCTSGCANVMTDSNNCGTCGFACPANATCSNGQCSCTGGGTLCNGTCTDTNSDSNNCGTCGHTCTGNCVGGTCTSSTGAGGNTGAGGSTGAGGGISTGAGGAGKGGSTGTGGSGSGTRACMPASTSVIADFEDGTGTEVVQGGRQGWWYVFSDANGGTQTPTSSATGPVAVAAATAPLPTGDTAMCDLYAMHSTATGHVASNAANYEGFGTSFAQILPAPAAGSKSKNAYDASAYDGISFNIKSGSGSAPPVWFELLNTETQPAPDGTATNNAVDEYNSRGMLLSNIGTSWTTIYVPFGLLAPRYLPNLTESQCSNSAVNCQAPAWNPKSALGLQFSVYPQFSTSTLNYDLWVDDVAFYTGSNGLATITPAAGTAHPFPVDGAVGSCTKPAGAAGKFLANMYTQWKAAFVTGSGSSTRIIRPENGNDTVSEGIGYGMLLAVYMGDKTLFDALWSYEQTKIAAGTLMTWCIPSGGGSCSSAFGGSGTDADEDMAFALVEAGKQWAGGTYTATAKTMIGDIWTHDIDPTSLLPTGGSNYGTTSSKPTNPSYFAPAYYRVFATIDTAHAWATVAANCYTAIAKVAGTNGLLPAWCGNNCSSVSSNGAADDVLYQYDAHRVPWRLGIDACWNGSAVPATGKTFLTNNATFFAGKAAGGVGRVVDIYTLSGAANSDAEPNSMSAVGSAGVGAMAAGNATFASTALRFLLDASYTPDPTTHKTAYTYYNATVGLITAMTLTGNFSNF